MHRKPNVIKYAVNPILLWLMVKLCYSSGRLTKKVYQTVGTMFGFYVERVMNF